MPEHNGYDLFMDVTDKQLQQRNRAVVMWNMFEDNSEGGKANAKGLYSMMNYMQLIPEGEKMGVVSTLRQLMEGRGNA